MQRISPIDLEHADIPTTWRGFDQGITRSLLATAASEMATLRQEVEKLRTQLSVVTQESEHLRRQESLMADALLLAKSAAEDCRKLAEREAAHIVDAAKSEAELMIAAATREQREAEQSVEFLRKQRSQFDRQFRTLLTDYLTNLESAAVAIPEPRSVVNM